MEDQGLRGRGSRIHSAFLPQSFRPRHLWAAWQIHSKLTRCARVAMALESSTVIIIGSQSQSRKRRAQERSRSGADGACQRGTNSPGKSHVPWEARQHPGAVILPSVPAPIHPWGQEPMGRAHFAQKEEAKSRGEG